MDELPLADRQALMDLAQDTGQTLAQVQMLLVHEALQARGLA